MIQLKKVDEGVFEIEGTPLSTRYPNATPRQIFNFYRAYAKMEESNDISSLKEVMDELEAIRQENSIRRTEKPSPD